jgi:hypothetical protein
MIELREDESIEFLVGLDLGQASDYTALAMLRRRYSSEVPKKDAPFEVPTLYRWPTGTPYTQIVKEVKAGLGSDAYRCQRVDWKGSVEVFDAPRALVIDGTGVGRGVVDLFREAGVPADLQAVTITGGDAVSSCDGYTRVPKRDLVGAVQVALQAKRLRIAPELREALTLQTELQNFKMKITAAANDTYGTWREGEHDDLVLATALALWWGGQDTFEPLGIGLFQAIVHNKWWDYS